ncbi:DEAD-box helicase [Babesia ovis]|uniref:DEAD-box helicase n=1 Tax=Babesia ovis TaxID=5869 RepID=A0A9W5WW72_BABOV|nr:DEAD-box helicase [Babesia ovis]
MPLPDRLMLYAHAIPYYNHALRDFAMKFTASLVDNEHDYSREISHAYRPSRAKHYGRYPFVFSAPKYFVDCPEHENTLHHNVEAKYKFANHISHPFGQHLCHRTWFPISTKRSQVGRGLVIIYIKLNVLTASTAGLDEARSHLEDVAHTDANDAEPADVGTLGWCARICEDIGEKRHLPQLRMLGHVIHALKSDNDDVVAATLVDRLGFEHAHFISQVIQFRKNLLRQWTTQLQILSQNILRNRLSQMDTADIQSLLLQYTGKGLEYHRADMFTGLSCIPPEEILNSLFAQQHINPVLGLPIYVPQKVDLNIERECNELFDKAILPPVNNPVVANDEDLIEIQSLPQWAQTAFAGIQKLNIIQSMVFNTAFQTSQNMLLSAPTGCGKTNVALLCTLQNFESFFAGGHKKGKVVYVAPMKALAAEVTSKFNKALDPLGLRVREVTGDTQIPVCDLLSIDVLITTPEKLDVITRNSNTTGTQSDDSFLTKVSCLIIDEVHLLNDVRGCVLETVVARLLRLIESTQATRRIVAISATLPNWQDVADFLRVAPEHAYYFGPEYRHVPLAQVFYGVKGRDTSETMLEICFDHVTQTLENGKQCIIFVHSRNETSSTAAKLIEMIQISPKHQGLFQPNRDLYKRFHKQLTRSNHDNISRFAEYCLSIHHAGMVRRDRDVVETMFKEGLIKVLISTSTLAWGVNLPANCVIIKGTFIGGMGVDRHLNYLELTQIMGRAGRPQFDTSGTGILITEHKNLNNYIKMQTEQLPIESQLHRHLENALNAEIVLGTVVDEADAVTWLRYTFLYVRMRKNALKYGLKSTTDEEVICKLQKIVHDAAVNLDKSKLIRYHESTGEFASTDLGRIAARYYVDFETIYNFAISLNPEISRPILPSVDSAGAPSIVTQPSITDEYIIEHLCECKEFENLLYRNDELEELTDLMSHSIFKPKRGLNHITTKISLLVEAHISRTYIKTSSLISDMNYIIQNVGRLLLAYFEVSISDTVCGPPVGDLIYKWVLMFERQVWDIQQRTRNFLHQFCRPYHASYDKNKMQVSKLPILSEATAARLSKYNLDALMELSYSELASIVKSKSEASAVQHYLRFVPYPQIDVCCRPITTRINKVNVTLTLNNSWSTRWNGKGESFYIWICSDDCILNKTRITLTANNTTDSVEMFIPQRGEEHYITLKVFSTRWLGITFEQHLRTHRLNAVEEGYTKLLKLWPMPTNTLCDGFQYKHRYLNPLQTQMFPYCLYGDDNLLVGAPTGSGKTVVAELCMFRLWRTQPEKKVVYIAPLKALAYERLKDWNHKFGSFKKVVEVTGDSRTCAREIANSDVIVTTPEKWDGISRHWKNRKYVRSIGLLVIDEVHLLGECRGAVLEAIVSRLCFITKFTETSTRLVCLSTALANPGQIADWLAVKPTKLFNFSPAVRPVACHLYIDGFPLKAYCPRMNSMNKPAFSAIMRHDMSAPVLVFVSSRRQTRTTAQDFVSLLQVKSLRWTSCNPMDKQFIDENLNVFVEHGIGIHHAGLHDSDRILIEEMFLRGDIKVLIATATLAWGVNLPAKIVIIKGTEYYDGKTKKYVDYSVTDIMQMVGRAGRRVHDKEAYAYIYTETRKVDFYKAFMFSPFPAESSFHERIIDSMNSEIASGTIANVTQVLQYLKNTFFYKRLQKNPQYYLNIELLKGCSDESTTESLLDCVISRSLQQLKELGCISTDNTDATLFEADKMLIPSVIGILSSQYYIACQTMAELTSALSHSTYYNSVFKILRIISNAKEFSEVPLRHNEDIYNMQLSSIAMMPIDAAEASNPHAKTFLLLQSRLFDLKMPIFDYNNDLKSVLDQLPRVYQAFIDLMACYRNCQNLQYAVMLYKHLTLGVNLLEQRLSFDDAALVRVKVVDVRLNRGLHGSVLSKRGNVAITSINPDVDEWYRYDVTGVNEVDVVVSISNAVFTSDVYYLTFYNECSNVLYGFKKITGPGRYSFRSSEMALAEFVMLSHRSCLYPPGPEILSLEPKVLSEIFCDDISLFSESAILLTKPKSFVTRDTILSLYAT